MTTRHTPGPYYFKDGMIVSEDTGETLAILPYHGDEPEQIATGILLAAAPELLRSLTVLTSVANQIHIDAILMFTAIEQAKAAIAKAEGGA